MIVFETDFLEIEQRRDLLIQSWKKNKIISPEQFQTELLQYHDVAKKIRPSKVLWIQKNFNLTIPSELYRWISKNIIQKQYDIGLKKQVFTIPKETSVFNSMLDFFTGVEQIFQPSYYVDKSAAISALNNPPTREVPIPEIRADEESDLFEIKLRVKPEDLQITLGHLKDLHHKKNFLIKNQKKFESLTPRELEIFNLIVAGLMNHEIAELLVISKETVVSHRKKIILKLNIHALSDWIDYANVYGSRPSDA